jgi:capsular exopolysaccharide synthesis family protein
VNNTLTIQQVLEIFTKRVKRMVFTVVAITILGILVGYYLPSTYESELDILINGGGPVSTTPTMNEIDSSLRLIETYKQIMKSDRVSGQVNKKLGGMYSKSELFKNVKIDSGNGSQIITIITRDVSASSSAKLANTYGKVSQEEIKRLMGLDNLTIMKEVSAEIDTKKISPNLLHFGILSFLIACTTYFVTILFLETYFPLTNSRLRVEKTLKIPFLGEVTQFKQKSKSLVKINKVGERLSITEKETFRTIASTVQHLVIKEKLKVLLVTSPSERENKSYVCSNLAVQLAEMGKKVLFIDANFKNPSGRRLFNLPERKGLTSVISNYYSVNEVVQETGIKGLSFMGTGPIPNNPTSYLTSKKVHEVIETVKTSFDIVLMDAAELSYSDTMNLYSFSDGCILLIDSQRTSLNKALTEVEILRDLDVNLLGTVLIRRGKQSKSM